MSACCKTLLIPITLLLCGSTIQACFFTDCPNSYLWNGKRGPEKSERPDRSMGLRKCPPCGLRGTGQCFSARMCCTPSLGCVVGENEITEPCRQESKVLMECASSGPRCIRRDPERGDIEVAGVCAADGLCCNSDGCTFQHQCYLSQKDPDSIRMSSDDILQAILGDLMKTMKPKHDSARIGFPDRGILETLNQFRRLREKVPYRLMNGEMY